MPPSAHGDDTPIPAFVAPRDDDILEAIEQWVRNDVAACAAATAHQNLAQMEPRAKTEHFERLNQQAMIEQRAAVRLVAMATLRMEGRRVALREAASGLPGSQDGLEIADKLANQMIAHERADDDAMARRQQWAQAALERMARQIEQEDLAGQVKTLDEQVALAAIDRGIDTLIFRQEEKRRARWATLGPAAVAARQSLAVEQLAVGRALRSTLRATILSDLLAVADGLNSAMRKVAGRQDKPEEIISRCEQRASQEAIALSGRARYRRQLVAWANRACLEMERPPTIEIRPVASGRSSRAPTG